jgi:hypothetical protein
MTPDNRRLRAARLQLAAATRLAGFDYARNLREEHIVNLRTIDSSFRILDSQPLPYEESLDHIAESVLVRSGSIQESKLVAACAYYLCQETISGYLPIRDRRASPALISFARRCDRLTGGKDDTRLFIFWSSLQGGFKEARPAVIAAIARSIGSSCAMPQRGMGWLTPCLALSLAAFASFQKGRNDVTGRLARQLSDVTESDGYRVIAEMFRARIMTAGSDADYFQAISQADARIAQLSPGDPAREIAEIIAESTRQEWTGANETGSSSAYCGFAAGIRLANEGDHARAAVAFDHAAEQPTEQDGDALWSARAAILAFRSRWQAFRSSGAIGSSELDSALRKLTSSNFTLARDYGNCQELLGLALDYCASRSRDEPYAWLAARVAELHGEFSAGLAVGSDRMSQQADDTAARELAVKDLLTGVIHLASEESLRAAAGFETIVWASRVIVNDEPVVVSVTLGPGDRVPRISRTIVHSDQGRDLLERATSADLADSSETVAADLATLRSWLFRQAINPAFPLVIISDRYLWSLPWGAVAPVDVAAMTLAPSVSATARLATHARTRVPVVAGVFDLQLKGAEAELAALATLHAHRQIILRQAHSVAELQSILLAERIDLLTVAAHGTSGDGFEYRLLFPDSPASPAGLLALRMPPNVVLGCCWSARLGEKADSLATAVSCLAAGASTVVGALWDVDDEVAGTILAAAYPDFAAGKNLSEAVRSAYRSMTTRPVSGAALTVLGLP